MIDKISFLKSMIERMRKLSSIEKKLMLAFIENKNIKATRLISLGRSYGISAMNTYSTLLSLIKKNLIIPVFYFPKDIGTLIVRVPFASVFLSFDEVLDVKSLSRRWRDKLSGSINDLKRACEDILSEVGYYRRPQSRLGGGKLWATLRKFYETTDPRRIVDYLDSLYSIAIPEESPDRYIMRMLSYSLLALWTSYFMATVHKDGVLLSELYLSNIEKMIKILNDNIDKIRMLQNKALRDLVSGKVYDIAFFALESIKEAGFSGIILEKEDAKKIFEKIEKIASIMVLIDKNNEEKAKKIMEKAKKIL